ncbi:MAG TPA: phage tail assembly protein [Ruminiclostridium sp.]|nr:phage tail assembly protein [Ruminiclostridium sp.]
MPFTTEFEFTLPKGYVDSEGNVCRKGTMRLATAADEILPMRDPRVQQNPAYLTVILLARVVKSLENVKVIDTHVIESLLTTDFAYLQSFYKEINELESPVFNTICPECHKDIDVQVSFLGESQTA